MIKTLLLFSAVFILSSCASSNSNPGSSQAESSPTAAHVSTTSGQAPADAGAESGGSGGDTGLGGAENNTELVAVDPLMEEVQVEGFKEKKHCTYVVQTGSRMKTKICLTASEAKQEREASKSWLNRVKETQKEAMKVPTDGGG
jgi:hypothetical protein